MHRAARLAVVRPTAAHLQDARQVVHRRLAAQAAATLVAPVVAHYLRSAAILAPTDAAVAVKQRFRSARSNPIAAV